MDHKWKTQSLSDVLKYNQYLLLSVVILSVLSLLLAFACVNKEEKWVIFPGDGSEGMEVSNKKLYPSYLKPWASYIAREMFTTSPNDVVEQHAQIRKIGSSNKELSVFFAEQLAFVQNSNASSVFFIKNAELTDGGVIINGTLNYWFAGSDKKITLEKSYLIEYKQGIRGVVLLNNIKELHQSDKEDDD
jgi:hypothetical protein